jgi:hypothetical protein
MVPMLRRGNSDGTLQRTRVGTGLLSSHAEGKPIGVLKLGIAALKRVYAVVSWRLHAGACLFRYHAGAWERWGWFGWLDG